MTEQEIEKCFNESFEFIKKMASIFSEGKEAIMIETVESFKDDFFRVIRSHQKEKTESVLPKKADKVETIFGKEEE